MPTYYYLRVEAVNLSNVFDDTRNLNVIRGASLSLRNAVKLLKKDFPKLNEITTGASVGLFYFETNGKSDEVKNQIKDIKDRLNETYWTKHFTFVIDIQPATNNSADNFLQDREKIIARNRVRQMQQLSVVMPDKNTEEDVPPCSLDNLRPATQKTPIQGESQPTSAATHNRFCYGREQKQKFYAQETRDEAYGTVEYTQDIQSLAQLPPSQSGDHSDWRQLNNKIAVLYLDGNGFSGIQMRHCQTPKTQIEFDNIVQKHRRDFLKNLLSEMKQDNTFRTQEDELRIETLLWGGDEMMFVLPAWKGIEVLNFFYQQSQEWEFKGERLTHAGGLVFCKAGTPIQRVAKLAKELAENVKDYEDEEKNFSGRKGNFFDYMVLESMDFPTEALDTTRKKQFGERLKQSRTPLSPWISALKDAEEQQCPTLKWVNSLKSMISKGQLYQLARAVVTDSQQGTATFDTQLKRMQEMVASSENPEEYINPKDGKSAFENKIEVDLNQLFPNDAGSQWRWLHLVELWDYWV